MNYESMKVFRDGNQLVIVLENAGKELEGMVMSMIGKSAFRHDFCKRG